MNVQLYVPTGYAAFSMSIIRLLFFFMPDSATFIVDLLLMFSFHVAFSGSVTVKSTPFVSVTLMVCPVTFMFESRLFTVRFPYAVAFWKFLSPEYVTVIVYSSGRMLSLSVIVLLSVWFS